jgi:hypothetical protein
MKARGGCVLWARAGRLMSSVALSLDLQSSATFFLENDKMLWAQAVGRVKPTFCCPLRAPLPLCSNVSVLWETLRICAVKMY